MDVALLFVSIASLLMSVYVFVWVHESMIRLKEMGVWFTEARLQLEAEKVTFEINSKALSDLHNEQASVIKRTLERVGDLEMKINSYTSAVGNGRRGL